MLLLSFCSASNCIMDWPKYPEEHFNLKGLLWPTLSNRGWNMPAFNSDPFNLASLHPMQSGSLQVPFYGLASWCCNTESARGLYEMVKHGKAICQDCCLFFSPDHCCSQTPLQPSVWRKPSAELYIGWSSNALWMKPPAISWHYSQLWNYDEDSSFDPKTIVRSIQVLCQDQIVTIPDTNAVRRTAHAEVIISILPSLETETVEVKGHVNLMLAQPSLIFAWKSIAWLCCPKDQPLHFRRGWCCLLNATAIGWHHEHQRSMEIM